jgi:hypothetical protein
MEKSGSNPTQVRGSKLHTVAIREPGHALVQAFRGLTAKLLARVADASSRTTEKWLDGSTAPTWKHTVAMLNDDELCARLLEAAGRGDLARSAETIAALKAVIASEGR